MRPSHQSNNSKAQYGSHTSFANLRGRSLSNFSLRYSLLALFQSHLVFCTQLLDRARVRHRQRLEHGKPLFRRLGLPRWVSSSQKRSSTPITNETHVSTTQAVLGCQKRDNVYRLLKWEFSLFNHHCWVKWTSRSWSHWWVVLSTMPMRFRDVLLPTRNSISKSVGRVCK